MSQRKLPPTHYEQRFNAWSERHAQHPDALKRAIATYEQWLVNPAELIGDQWKRYGYVSSNGESAES